MIPTIKKTTHLARNTATPIDHIMTHTVVSEIWDRSVIPKNWYFRPFPIVFALNKCEKKSRRLDKMCL